MSRQDDTDHSRDQFQQKNKDGWLDKRTSFDSDVGLKADDLEMGSGVYFRALQKYWEELNKLFRLVARSRSRNNLIHSTENRAKGAEEGLKNLHEELEIKKTKLKEVQQKLTQSEENYSQSRRRP